MDTVAKPCMLPRTSLRANRERPSRSEKGTRHVPLELLPDWALVLPTVPLNCLVLSPSLVVPTFIPSVVTTAGKDSECLVDGWQSSPMVQFPAQFNESLMDQQGGR